MRLRLLAALPPDLHRGSAPELSRVNFVSVMDHTVCYDVIGLELRDAIEILSVTVTVTVPVLRQIQRRHLCFHTINYIHCPNVLLIFFLLLECLLFCLLNTKILITLFSHRMC